MPNDAGPATRRGAGAHRDRTAKSYELSFLRSNTMPQSPFAVPLRENARPTVGNPGTRHAFNADEVVSGDPGQQGTQMDALGHFAVVPEAWDGKGEFPSGRATYYGGYTQSDVKPTPDSAAQEARHRQGAADRHQRGAARRQGASGAAAPCSRANWSPPRTSRRCSRRKGWSAAACSPATCSTSTPAGAITGKIPTPRSSTTPRDRASLRRRQIHRAEGGRAGGARQSVHRSGGRRLPAGQGGAAGGDAARPAVRDPSPQSGGRRHPQHPERQSRRLGEGQGLAVLHDDLPLRSQGVRSPVRPVAIGAPAQR